MKTIIVPVAALLLVGVGPLLLAKPPALERRTEQAALAGTLLGEWHGQTPCAGNFHFHADGTYALTQRGPAPDDSAGVWKVRRDVQPPAIVLTCKTSEIPDEVGKTAEVWLIRSDHETLAVRHANQTVDRYSRVKE